MKNALIVLSLRLAALAIFAVPALAEQKMNIHFECAPQGEVGRSLCAHMEEQFAMSPLFHVLPGADAAGVIVVRMRATDIEGASRAAYSCVVTRKMDDAADGPERYLFNELGLCTVSSSECAADKMIKDIYSTAR